MSDILPYPTRNE